MASSVRCVFEGFIFLCTCLLFPLTAFHAQLSSEEVEGLYRCLDEAEREQVPCGEGEEGQEGKEEGGHSADKAASCFFSGDGKENKRGTRE